MNKTDEKLLFELAELYGIEIRKVQSGEGGLIINNKKLTPEEAFKMLFGDFKNEV